MTTVEGLSVDLGSYYDMLLSIEPPYRFLESGTDEIESRRVVFVEVIADGPDQGRRGT